MFAVYQQGFAIFGVGETEQAALVDAQEWADGPISLGTPGVPGDMVVMPCTDDLAEMVPRWGGDLPVQEDDQGRLAYDDTHHNNTQPSGLRV